MARGSWRCRVVSSHPAKFLALGCSGRSAIARRNAASAASGWLAFHSLSPSA